MRKVEGFSIVEAIIIVIVIAVIGALGVVGYNSWNKSGTQQANTATTTAPAQTTPAPDVKTTNDLDTVTTTLDNANLDSASNDTQQLSTQSNF